MEEDDVVVETKRTLFVDLDGVIADFEQHYENLFGHRHDAVPAGIMWRNIHKKEDWWYTMPPMDHFVDFWNSIKHLNPVILTGCPPANYQRAVDGKIIWCEKYLGPDVEVITCRSKDKPKHMKAAGDILIDDLSKNCDRWREAGGISLQFAPENWKVISNLAIDLMEEDLDEEISEEGDNDE